MRISTLTSHFPNIVQFSIVASSVEKKMNKHIYSLSLLVSSKTRYHSEFKYIESGPFGLCFFAGTTKPCDYGQVYSNNQCVGKF